MAILAGLPAKFYSAGIHRNDRIPAGITGASQRPPPNAIEMVKRHLKNFYNLIVNKYSDLNILTFYAVLVR
jgi:hypothetical protein